MRRRKLTLPSCLSRLRHASADPRKSIRVWRIYCRMSKSRRCIRAWRIKSMVTRKPPRLSSLRKKSRWIPHHKRNLKSNFSKKGQPRAQKVDLHNRELERNASQRADWAYKYNSNPLFYDISNMVKQSLIVLGRTNSQVEDVDELDEGGPRVGWAMAICSSR
jgi:hypothetical protein